MKRIVVLCDGTWNSPDMEDTTHVKALDELLEKDQPGQLVKYFTGVGTNDPYEKNGRFVSRGLNKLLGGATGFGLGKKVKEAYQFIAEHYEDGDEIYLFGFSRGAYTVRSVAGMIRKAGLVADATPANVRKAFRLYRKSGDRNRPDKPHIRKKRARLSPHFATSEEDATTRPGGTVPIVNIAYLGVWDTVGQRGLPTQLLGPFAAVWNQLYAFHDMALSSLVQSARHAVAVDEQRIFYRPATWKNLPDLNALHSEVRFEQKWFVGDHGIVGGSAKLDAVSCFTLKWVAEKAGLTLRPGKSLDHPEANILADMSRLDDPGTFYKLVKSFLEPRDGVNSLEELDDTVVQRVKGRPDYRPGSIKRFVNSLLS